MQPKARILKVGETGDFWRKRTCPLLRLQGKWLQQAGIPSNAQVRVENPRPGVLVIQIVQSAA